LLSERLKRLTYNAPPISKRAYSAPPISKRTGRRIKLITSGQGYGKAIMRGGEG